MNSINYETIFRINSHCIVYSNGVIEPVVQLVNDKYIVVEIEGNDIEYLKRELSKINIPYENDNYFVKKAQIALKEILSK